MSAAAPFETNCPECGVEFVDPQPAPALCSDRCERLAATCIDGPDGCRGPVELRYPGYGCRSFRRCERHGRARIEREDEARRKYSGPEPADFDPRDAGESWE